MAISRRDLLTYTLAGSGLTWFPQKGVASSHQPLSIPPLIDTRQGTPAFLNLLTTRYRLQEELVEVWGVNGRYLGPTLKIYNKQFVKLNYNNQLDIPVAMTMQGVLVRGELIGGANRIIPSNQSWSPILPIDQAPSTAWYHACTTGSSAYQVYRGLAGLCIIDNLDRSDQGGLPNTYGVNDIPLILQDMQFNRQGEQLFDLERNRFFGDILLVNGQISPYIDVSRGWLRLRLLNASISRTYYLQFDDDRPMLKIGTGMGLVETFQSYRTLLLAPGERLELLVDFNQGGGATLLAGSKLGFFNQLRDWFKHSDRLKSNQVLTIRPQGAIAVFTNRPTLPAPLRSKKWSVVGERQLHLDAENALLNQRKLDFRRIDISAKLHTVERWVVSVTEPLAFYIQGAKFRQQVGETLSDWQDVIYIERSAILMVQFERSSTNQHPFVFGAADLRLADKGCLGLLVVN